MRKLVFATNNTHKLEEVKAILADTYQVVSLAELNCTDEIPETAETLEGNALLKAQYVYNKFGVDCFADDTGLEIDSLGGEPGVYSARYAGEEHSADKNMSKVLIKLGDISNRSASFRTVIVLILGGKISYFEGRIEGDIALSPQGKTGFGYDPIFIPNGYEHTLGELDESIKSQISHRAKALNLAKPIIKMLQKKSKRSN